MPSAKPTLRKVAETWYARQRQDWTGQRTERTIRQQLEKYATTLMAMPVDTITREHVLDTLLAVEGKPITRDKVRKTIRAIMGWGILRNHRPDNPCDEVVAKELTLKRSVTQHHAALPYSGIPEAMERIDATTGWFFGKLAVRYIALTLCRSGEVRGARWDEIDLEARTWTVPGERMKSRKVFTVPLSAPAIEVLNRAQELSDGGDLVFPSPLGKVMDSGRLSEPMRFAKLGGTPHGFRSSFRTWAAEQGVPRDVAEMVLAHQDGSVTELSYKRTDFFMQRVALMERWAAVIEGSEPQAEIVEFAAAAQG